MNYMSQRRQLANLLVTLAASAVIALCGVGLLYAYYALVQAFPSLAVAAYGKGLVAQVTRASSDGLWLEFCLVFIPTYVLGLALFMFPPAQRLNRVRR